MPQINRSRLILVAAALAAFACSDSPTGPSTSVPDVAALLSEMSPASVSSVAAFAGSGVGASTTSAPVRDPGICSYSSTTGYFVCPTVTVNGVTFIHTFRLIDAAGHSQSKPDAQTSAIQTKDTVRGTVSTTVSGGGNGPITNSYTIDGSSDRTLSALRAENHVLNGVSTTHINGLIELGPTSFPIDVLEKETTANLVLPNAKKGQRWPLSGTISVDHSASGDSFGGDATHAVITFNGTSVITMTITTSFGTITCHFDMAAPAGSQDACVG